MNQKNIFHVTLSLNFSLTRMYLPALTPFIEHLVQAREHIRVLKYTYEHKYHITSMLASLCMLD